MLKEFRLILLHQSISKFQESSMDKTGKAEANTETKASSKKDDSERPTIVVKTIKK